MARYGIPVDPDYDPDKEHVYSLMSVYFDNPKMTKIRDIPEPRVSVYMAKTSAMLGIEHRYIVAICPIDIKGVGSQEYLSNLLWISIQTRTLSDNHNIPVHNYIPRKLPELNKKITRRIDSTDYLYDVDDLPINITLIPKTKGLDYSSSGTVVIAIETYSTIITWRK